MANGGPHSHNVEIKKREYDNTCKVKYGDTTVRARRWLWFYPTDRAIRAAINRAIRRHDKGSLKHAKLEQRHRSLEAGAMSGMSAGQWASDQHHKDQVGQC